MDTDDLGLKPIVRHFHIADYSIFSLTLIISLLIGVYYACTGGKQKTVQEYLLGDKNMGVFPIAMSLLASFLSAIGMIAVPAEVYMYGGGIINRTVGMIISIPIAAYFYLPTFYKLQMTSVYEYLERRFDSRIRKIGSLMFIFQMLVYISFVIYAPALALSQVTGLNLWGSVLALGILGTFYTSIGGIKAVMWTDVFQLTIMFMAILLTVFKGTFDLGGFEFVFSKNVEGKRLTPLSWSLDPRIRYTIWNGSIGSLTNWVAVYGTNQAQVQRYLTSPSMKAARRTLWWNLLGLSCFNILTVYAGLVLYAKYWNCDPLTMELIKAPDQIYPLFVMETLEFLPGLSGLFVAGVFSGSLSTVSSALNSLAAITLEDYVKAFNRWKNISSEKAAIISKIIASSYGMLCLVMVAGISNLGSIMQANNYNSRTFGGIVFGLFTLGMFFPWANRIGAYAGIAAGFAFATWVSVGSQTHKSYTPKAPISVEGCFDMYGNDTNPAVLNFTLPTTLSIGKDSQSQSENVFFLYQISFLWIQFISCMPVIIVGAITSYFTGPTKLKDLDLRLLSPVSQYIVKKYFSNKLSKQQSYKEDALPEEMNTFLKFKSPDFTEK